jgi:hypothetical protein
MDIIPLRDLDDARLFLLQGLCLQRVLPVPTLRPPLEWALELASEGLPLPPVCLVADVGHVAFGLDWEARASREPPAISGGHSELVRMYEDYVLGKVYADWTFARASDALRHYPEGRDRARGLAFLLDQFRQRAGFGGVELSPAVIKGVLDIPPEAALAEGRESLQRDGWMPLLAEKLFPSLIAGARGMAEVLAPKDVFMLEHRTALHPLAQRTALDQVLQAADFFEQALPQHRIRPLIGRQEVPTRVLDEDTYPVGGFSSLSTRGSVESLLHSQLAYMETDERPDLFDIKYLRDELLYYARDENQFLRRRRTFAFVLCPDLVHARFKDAGLPFQRVILLWALLVVIVRKLAEWLSTDALSFVFFFLADPNRAEKSDEALGEERRLLQTLLREQIENGTVTLADAATLAEVEAACTLRARRSLCHCLAVSAGEVTLHPVDTVVTRLRVNAPCPALADGDRETACPEADTLLESWQAALEQVLQRWI